MICYEQWENDNLGNNASISEERQWLNMAHFYLMSVFVGILLNKNSSNNRRRWTHIAVKLHMW